MNSADARFELIDMFIACHEDSGDVAYNDEANKRLTKDIQEFEDLLEEHTHQRLEELKEKVEGMYADTRRYPDKTFKLVDKNEVITLIEQLQAKHI